MHLYRKRLKLRSEQSSYGCCVQGSGQASTNMTTSRYPACSAILIKRTAAWWIACGASTAGSMSRTSRGQRRTPQTPELPNQSESSDDKNLTWKSGTKWFGPPSPEEPAELDSDSN